VRAAMSCSSSLRWRLQLTIHYGVGDLHQHIVSANAGIGHLPDANAAASRENSGSHVLLVSAPDRAVRLRASRNSSSWYSISTLGIAPGAARTGLP
jgi:hypothetical protein